MHDPTRTSPILKWAGGKSWAAKEFGDDIFAVLQSRGGTYFEPFLGGAAMALWLGWKDMILADIEEDLIEVYQAIQKDPEQVHQALLELDGGSYYKVRDEVGDLNLYQRAARIIYLNKRCFNGLYRKNADGGFNVPEGKWSGSPPALPAFKQLQAVHEALGPARIVALDFEAVIRAAGENDVVYCDPPYAKTFGDYSPAGFGYADQERLSIALRAAAYRGASIFAHNSDQPEVRNWYQWAEITTINERRSISRKGNGRKPVSCVFIASCPTLK